MRRPRIVRALAIIALLAASSALAFASPAAATTKPIGLSTDGVTFTDTLPGSLFAGAMIVPGKSATRTFWVKNRTVLPANFGVALQGVTGIDPALISALSLRATAGLTTGSTVAFTAANPCVSVLSGIAISGGAILKVDVVLSLASSLTSDTSQESIGKFKVPVTMTSTDVPAPDGCLSSSPVTPPHGGGPAEPPAVIDTVVISGFNDGTVPVVAGPLAGARGNGTLSGRITIPNTGRFWQEIDVAAWLILLIVGGILAWRRGRRRDLEESYA